MKFSLRQTEKGTTELGAVPENLDAWPVVTALRSDRRVNDLSADRLAIACVLAFGPWCSGQLTFPKQISSLTAQQLSTWAPGRWLHAFPVHPANLPIPRGTNIFDLERHASSERDPRAASIFSMPAAVQQSSTIRGETIELASNAWMLETGSPQTLDSWAPHLALSVLFSEQLGIDSLRVTGLLLQENERRRLQALLACGGLGVEII